MHNTIDRIQSICYNVAMNNITKTINSTFNQKFDTYELGEFLPIFEGDVLVNQTDFYLYKAGKASEALGRAFMQTARLSARIGSVVANHFANS